MNEAIVERVASRIFRAHATSVGWADLGRNHKEVYFKRARAAIEEVLAPIVKRRDDTLREIERYEHDLAEFGGEPHIFDPQGLYPRLSLLNTLIEEMGGDRVGPR